MYAVLKELEVLNQNLVTKDALTEIAGTLDIKIDFNSVYHASFKANSIEKDWKAVIKKVLRTTGNIGEFLIDGNLSDQKVIARASRDQSRADTIEEIDSILGTAKRRTSTNMATLGKLSSSGILCPPIDQTKSC